jgi:hypothetical protein
VTLPTAASAFDIGGLIGTAMAIRMNGHHGGGYAGGGYHARSVYRPARTATQTTMAAAAAVPVSVTPWNQMRRIISLNLANKLAMQSPASTSGGLSQASERDAAAGQASGSSRSFNDAPAFTPSR